MMRSVELATRSELSTKYPEYLYANPETFVNKEQREWAAQSSVAHIAPLWLPLPRDKRMYGGAEDVVNNNINALSQYGIKNQIVFGHPENKSLERSVKNTKVVTPSYISPDIDLFHTLMTNPQLAEKLERLYVLEAYRKISDNKDRISVVHDHTSYGRDQGVFVSEYIKPVVRTEHGPLIQPDVTAIDEKYLRHFENQNNMGFIAISENQKSQMPNLNWLGVNHNGVDLHDFDYVEKKDDYLLFLGRIAHSKGTHNAIKVAQNTGIPLVIAGAVEQTPDSIEYFEKEVEPHIDGSNVIHYDKGVNAEDRKELMSHARSLLMLIEWPEPFGMVMAEAMASGTPVIGYRKGSVPEIVTPGTGFVVDNMLQAEDAVYEILDGNYSPIKCRKRVEENFSKEAMAARNINIYMDAEKRFNQLALQPREELPALRIEVNKRYPRQLVR